MLAPVNFDALYAQQLQQAQAAAEQGERAVLCVVRLEASEALVRTLGGLSLVRVNMNVNMSSYRRIVVSYYYGS